jgi:sialate O-acetylesterase
VPPLLLRCRGDARRRAHPPPRRAAAAVIHQRARRRDYDESMTARVFILLAVAARAAAFSPFTVARSFSEHAVLQAAPARARVWGWTTPGGVVSAFLNCSAINVTTSFNVTADGEGLWVAAFPPVPASNHACVVAFTDVTSTAAVWYLDILFGTVLLCLGQSNQDLPLSYIINGTTSERDAANNYPTVRLLQVPLQAYSSGSASAPLREFAALAPWARADNYTTASFSAECFLVARGLVDAARRADPAVDGVPVGAIQSDWPGDPILSLSSAAAVAQCGGPTVRGAAGVAYPGPIPGPHFPSSFV